MPDLRGHWPGFHIWPIFHDQLLSLGTTGPRPQKSLYTCAICAIPMCEILQYMQWNLAPRTGLVSKAQCSTLLFSYTLKHYHLPPTIYVVLRGALKQQNLHLVQADYRVSKRSSWLKLLSLATSGGLLCISGYFGQSAKTAQTAQNCPKVPKSAHSVQNYQKCPKLPRGAQKYTEMSSGAQTQQFLSGNYFWDTMYLHYGMSSLWVQPNPPCHQGCIFRLTCSYPELTEDHVLTSA